MDSGNGVRVDGDGPHGDREHDPALRDRVGRLVAVLDRAARARGRPTRHTRGHPGMLPLVDVTDQLAIRRPAAAGDEILRVSRDVPHQVGTYDALFDLHRLAAEAPEAVELVLAGGLLHHADPELHVHLVTRPVTIEHEPARGELVVALAGDAVAVEDEPLGGTGLVDAVAAAAAGVDVGAALASPLDHGLTDVLRTWAERCLRVPHEVGDDWIAPDGPRTRLVPAPTLLARRRGAHTARALRAVYERIAAEIADPIRPLPVGLAQLVEPLEPAERAAWLARAGHDAPPLTDPLFPLPVGAAQGRILTRLGRDSGVVVEGPPGTGKTHTIANLLCALLAEGRRVLVTSEKAQALRVLRDKLPAEMRELCVAVTTPTAPAEPGADADPRTDLAAAIAGIAAATAEFDPDRAEREIAELDADRRALLARRDGLLDALVADRAAETADLGTVAPGFTGSRVELAHRIAATRPRDGWLAEVAAQLPGELPAQPPLTGAEAAELHALLASETPGRRARVDQYLPPAVELPPESHVAELVAVVGRGDAAVSGADGRLVGALGDLPAEQAGELPAACRRVADALATLDGDDGEWARGVVDAVLAGRASALWSRAVEQLGRVDEIVAHDREAGPAQILVGASTDPAAAAPAVERFAGYLRAGGPVKRFLKGDAQKAVEPHLADVRVHGADPATPAGADAIAHHLRILEATDHLADGFGPLGRPVRRAEHRSLLVEQALALRATCRAIGAALAAAGSLRSLLAALPPHRRPDLDGLAALEAVPSVTAGVADTREATLARAELAEIIERIGGGVPEGRWAPEIGRVVAALQGQDAAAYAAAVSAVEGALAEQRDQRRADRLAARLDDAVPGLVEHLRDERRPWTDRIARWPQAWAHARAVARLAAAPPVDADAALDDVEAELGRVTARLAAARAWRACLTGISVEQMRALHSHRGADAAVGRGTGRWADRFRRAAREAVGAAREAVPAWVMPIREVLATVDPVRDAFDVVVVDEASQADLTSLFLLWLAPRVIVVGDDRQCTPAEVGVGSLDPAFARLDADLPDVPFWLRTQFTPRASLFSVFRTTFGPPVRLREHFRSMPEIIEWSSRTFYSGADDGGPLVPLRQYGADRLAPLRATFVPDAEVSGGGAGLANPAEAAALVDAVVRAAKDPAYDDATFGVVVLQGHGQIELIGAMLRERLDAGVWEARRLRVGAPADFQGDERTVVWLSMVVAPGHRLVALTADRHRQGFNVAASRAQDQLWLFASVAADDLAPADLRRALLEHVTAAEPAGFLGDPPTGVHPDRRDPAFGSRFAQRVFVDLSARGYAVVPEVTLPGRRLDLDLVVAGAAGRVAVVCDGDERHRPADRAEIVAEQDLRRCGWPVVRLTESAYALDPDTTLAPLLATLAAAGVRPVAPDEPAPASVVERAPGRGQQYVPGGLGAPPDTVDALVDELVAAGFAPPRRDAEIRDPRDGSLLVLAAALWPTGISNRALAGPVVLSLDADPYAVSRLRGLGYDVMVSTAQVRDRLRE